MVGFVMIVIGKWSKVIIAMPELPCYLSSHFELELYEKLVHPAGNNCMIVIVPLDKSMLICSNDDNVYLLKATSTETGASLQLQRKRTLNILLNT